MIKPDAREGQAGRPGEAERFIVLMKPDNAGGGKGPQFKTNARRSEGPGDWATYQLRRVFRNCRRRCTRKRRQKPATGSMLCTTRSAVKTFWLTPMRNAALTRAHRGWTARLPLLCCYEALVDPVINHPHTDAVSFANLFDVERIGGKRRAGNVMLVADPTDHGDREASAS